jgi:thiol-disulfide isomerase/thioredoxin
MAVIPAADEQLRHLVYAHDCAIVKYTSPTCSVCQDLAPFFEQLSNEEKYKDLLFLSIDSEQNQIAKQFLAERATPLVVTYHNGTVLEANTAYTVEDMQRMLDTLVEHRRNISQSK